MQHMAILGLLEFFFPLEVKIKQKCCTKHNREKQAPSITVQSTKIMFLEKSSKIN